MEIWKDVKDYEDKYQVSNLGKVRSKERYFNNNGGLQKVYEKILKQHRQYRKNDNEYLFVNFSIKHKTINKLVHRLVAQAFLENYNEYLEVNHKDGNKTNNNINNLEMMTRNENVLHSYNILKRKTNGKIICQYDINNNFIKEYNSACEAYRETQICRSCINDCCNGRIKTAGGYIWRFK